MLKKFIKFEYERVKIWLFFIWGYFLFYKENRDKLLYIVGISVVKYV